MQMASEFILKSLTGVSDDKEQEFDWPVTMSPLSLFTFLINAERCIYLMTGRGGGRGEKKQTAILEGEREKMGACG